MRWLGRLILLVVLGWFAFGAVNSLLQWQGWRTSTVLDWEQDFTAYPVFWLDGQQLLVFDIPANAEQVRVQLTPTFDSATNTANDSTAVNTSSSSEYRVHYQLFNDTGVVTDEATRHYLLDQTLEVVEPGQIPDRFFERPDGQGAQLTSGFFIDNRRGEPVRRLTLGLQQNNLAVAGVVGNVGGVAVRVSVLERKNEQDLPILWQRMHRDKRLALMAENIYPAELVSEEQRRTALQYSWLPLGPEGIEGEEYKAATLFIKKLIVTSVDEHAVFTRNHMLASPKQVFTFFQTGELTVDTLSCEALDGVPLDWLELLEQDPQNPQTLSRRIFIGADLDAPIKLEAKPVLYQIRTSALCQLRLIDQQGNPVDLPPKVQRSYLVNPESLVFALAVQGKAVQPIRLDVRGLLVNGLAVNGIGTQGGIDWQVQDKDGNNILSGNLDLLPVQDMFEALPISTNEEQLFSKHSTFILAPAAGVKLVVQSADAQALVSVFTRPLNLSYKDDFDQGSLHGKAEDILQGKSQRKAQELPQWFMLLPKGANRLKADGLTRLIYRQQRPKLPDVVEPGLSQWQALKSVDDPPTYPLFVGQSNAAKIDSVTVAANYQLIEGATVAGTEVGFSANFVVDRQAKTLSPKLVYVQPSPKVQKVQVSIDGKTFDYWLGAQAGQITLPSINVGEHHIS
ncbi:MAG: hypothetical protein HRT35_32410, partial [Algicola sp.]|nr:hypothetical protein [Algicola sp.]